MSLTINGTRVTEDAAPRTHLADFLREHLNLTGTHLGCEHGVCGACTVLIDGAPARACINFASLCEGADVVTIEGLANDPITARLRAAFTAEHALQCGYCTPGMLVTARDILLRLPDADETRIRRELAGNLCRCTGYQGIVRAIQRVQAQGLQPPPAPAILPAARFEAPRITSAPATLPAGAPGLSQTLHLAVPVARAWAAVQDIELVAACVPGLVLDRAAPDDLAGTLTASFGPISARFAGTGHVAFADHRGTITARGRDAGSRTALDVIAQFTVQPGPHTTEATTEATTEITIDITYSLRGPLAQLARPAIVGRFAADILAQVAARLQAHLLGAVLPPQPRLRLGHLMWRWWRSLFDRA